MNDWLDYKGSGSSRAYTTNGLMSDSNISHGLFGIQTKKDKAVADAKQREADERYKQACLDKLNKLNKDYEKASQAYADASKQRNTLVQSHASEEDLRYVKDLIDTRWRLMNKAWNKYVDYKKSIQPLFDNKL